MNEAKRSEEYGDEGANLTGLLYGFIKLNDRNIINLSQIVLFEEKES